MELADDDLEELNRKLCILHNLTRNTKTARDHPVHVTVTHFVPCTDPNHEAYGKLGLYQQTTGICWNITPGMNGTITVDREKIRLKAIHQIDSPDVIFDDDFGDE